MEIFFKKSEFRVTTLCTCFFLLFGSNFIYSLLNPLNLEPFSFLALFHSIVSPPLTETPFQGKPQTKFCMNDVIS